MILLRVEREAEDCFEWLQLVQEALTTTTPRQREHRGICSAIAAVVVAPTGLLLPALHLPDQLETVAWRYEEHIVRSSGQHTLIPSPRLAAHLVICSPTACL